MSEQLKPQARQESFGRRVLENASAFVTLALVLPAVILAYPDPRPEDGGTGIVGSTPEGELEPKGQDPLVTALHSMDPDRKVPSLHEIMEKSFKPDRFIP